MNDTPNNANTQRRTFFESAQRGNYLRAVASDPVAVRAYEDRARERQNVRLERIGMPTV